MSVVGTSASAAPAAASANATVKPRSSRIAVPASVCAEMLVAAICAPNAAPIVRMMRFMPLATAVLLRARVGDDERPEGAQRERDARAEHGEPDAQHPRLVVERSQERERDSGQREAAPQRE